MATTKKTTKTATKGKPLSEKLIKDSIVSELTNIEAALASTWSSIIGPICLIGPLYAELMMKHTTGKARRIVAKDITNKTMILPKNMSIIFRASIWFAQLLEDNLTVETTKGKATRIIDLDYLQRLEKPIGKKGLTGLTLDDMGSILRFSNNWKNSADFFQCLQWFCSIGPKKFNAAYDKNIAANKPEQDKESEVKDITSKGSIADETAKLTIATMSLDELTTMLEDILFNMGDMALVQLKEVLGQFLTVQADQVEQESLVALGKLIDRNIKTAEAMKVA